MRFVTCTLIRRISRKLLCYGCKGNNCLSVKSCIYLTVEKLYEQITKAKSNSICCG